MLSTTVTFGCVITIVKELVEANLGGYVDR